MFIFADFGTRKALLVDGRSGELIGLAGLPGTSLSEAVQAAAAKRCTVICVEESACSCDGFAHGSMNVWRGEREVVSVPLYGHSSDALVSERVRAKEAAVSQQIQVWKEQHTKAT